MKFSKLLNFVLTSIDSLSTLNLTLIHPILESIREKKELSSNDVIFISIFNKELVPRFNELISFLHHCRKLADRSISLGRDNLDIDREFENKVKEFSISLQEHITRSKNVVNDYNNNTGVFS